MTEKLQARPKSEENVGAQMARGAGWMMLLKLSIRSLGLVSTLILVRLLTPSDFGLIAMAMVFISIIEVLSWFSFDMALIQHPDPKRAHYNTAWTLNVLFKLLSALVLAAIALPAAAYYQTPDVSLIIAALALGVALEGFQNVGVVNFRRDMEFDKEFRFMLIPKIAAFLVTVPLAFLWRNYWALVVGMLTGRIVNVLISYYLSDYRPQFSLRAHQHLFNFSKWVFLANLFHALRNRGAELLIGRLSGVPALGLFTVSFEISNLPTTEMVAPINRAVFPGYAKLSGDLTDMRHGYLSVIGMIALFAVPAGVGIAATAPLLVPVALGEQWLDAIPLIKWLALFGVMVALQTNMTSLFLALGKPRTLTVLSALHAIVMLAMVVPALLIYGVIGVAASYVFSTLVTMPVNFAVLCRTLNLKPRRLLACVYRPLLASAVMYVAVVYAQSLLADGASVLEQILQLIMVSIAGAGFFAVLVLTIWSLAGRPQGAEHTLCKKLVHFYRSKSTG